MLSRECVRCHVTKPIMKFKSVKKIYRSHTCNSCKHFVSDWPERNRNKVLKYYKTYRRKNPEWVKENSRSRNARKRGAFVERVEKSVVFEMDDGICRLCGLFVDPGHWDLDHTVPLAKGGMHGYNNVQVAHPSCNRRKSDRMGWTAWSNLNLKEK